jgi:hypothetical protein
MAVHRRSPAVVQDWRAERRALRAATVTAALSERVRRKLQAKHLVSAAVSMPVDPLPIVDQPIAALVADWSWAPNSLALQQLLASWDPVRERVTGATLLIAGRGTARIGDRPGVRLIGEVADATEVLAGAAVLAFPCPPSSGPKIKVLEAMAAGLPVVTTAAGVEGLHSEGVEVSSMRDFAERLSAVLLDPARRVEMASRARLDVASFHSAQIAASQRLALFG